MGFFDLLFDSVFLWLEREHGRVSLGECVQVSLSFLGRDCDELGCHQVAHGTDILLIVDAGDDTVEQLSKVLAGEGGVKGGVEGFVGAL